MKGLLLKDFYMAKRYFGWFMLVIAGMLIMSCLVEDMQIFSIYPMIVNTTNGANIAERFLIPELRWLQASIW